MGAHWRTCGWKDGEAQQPLEMAEIENALHTLSTGDHAGAIRIIDATISHASAVLRLLLR